ncbi:ABC transporter glutamine-binding protein GlnH precursor [Corynebacterium capitovis DSM 44611]|uniref:glutamate ABC transporter substrate-binding protein n=1 Tax=Corynebacterium capitovis TaxID=131081 RepID=UPI000371D382|nr:glutamate ABC transporter substrate-binding protein [Corynebacterium capitovis]WKD58212.1 ABC transporter glutamine-binding protein GlnH precursor [Corynebacterium capitovis DSM 44611]
MRRAHPASGACLLLAALVSGCTAAPAPTAPSDPPLAYSGLPLPPGAELDAAGVAPERDFNDASSWEGSLRPDSGATAGTGDAEKRVPDIVRRGRIIVGVDQYQYLLSYRDAAAGELRGFEVDLAKQIALDIFGDASKVDFRFVDSSKRVSALEAGDVDIVVRTMSITPERSELVDFSVPYLSSSIRLLTPMGEEISDIASTAGHTLCAVDGSNVVELARTLAPDSPILRTRTWTDCLMATQQYQADAILADDVILAGLSAQDPHLDVVGESYGSQSYAIGVTKGNDGLVRQVNATLERVRHDGTWARLYNSWLSGTLASPVPPEPRYRTEEEKPQ